MKLRIGMLLGLLGALSSQMVFAQCGSVRAKKTSFQSPAFEFHGALKSVAYGASGLQSTDDWRKREAEPLVGLWKVSFVDSSQNYSDNSYITYHSDFTEFQNSERVPSTGAVCQGVWERTGRSTYRVNHYALGYADNMNLTNVIRIREYITMEDSGTRFSGTFIEDVYDTAHRFIVEFKGPMTGKRVMIDSEIDSQ